MTPADLIPQVRRLMHDVEDCSAPFTNHTVQAVVDMARVYMQDQIVPYRNPDSAYISFLNAGLHKAGCNSGPVTGVGDTFPMPDQFLMPVAYFMAAQISLQDDEFSASGGRVTYMMQQFDEGIRRSTDEELLAWLNQAVNDIINERPDTYLATGDTFFCAQIKAPVDLGLNDTIPLSEHWRESLVYYVAGNAMMKRDKQQDYHKARYYLSRYDRALVRSGIAGVNA